jgi:hypothetical protein
MEATAPDASSMFIARWLEFRMSRQQVLTGDEPVEFEAIFDEAILHRPIGGPEVMHEQLMHLVEVAQHRNVTIHVLPFTAGAHAGSAGAFTIFEMPTAYPDVAYIETRAGSIYMEAEGVEPFNRAYDNLKVSTLSPEDSLAFLRTHAERLSQ